MVFTPPEHHLGSSVSEGVKAAELPCAYSGEYKRVQQARTRQAHVGALPAAASWPQTPCSSGSCSS